MEYVNMETEDDVGVHVEELGIEFYTDVDFRTTRVLTLDLQSDVGLNLIFDPNVGSLNGELNIDSQNMIPSIVQNEFSPENHTLIEASFRDQFGTLLNLIDIGSLLGDLQFLLPSINEVGVTQLQTNGSGSAQEDLGLFISVGPVPYVGGCSSEESGCTTTGPNNGRYLLATMALVLGLARRRSNKNG